MSYAAYQLLTYRATGNYEPEANVRVALHRIAAALIAGDY